jgi:hypothetical protein
MTVQYCGDIPDYVKNRCYVDGEGLDEKFEPMRYRLLSGYLLSLLRNHYGKSFDVFPYSPSPGFKKPGYGADPWLIFPCILFQRKGNLDRPGYRYSFLVWYPSFPPSFQCGREITLRASGRHAVKPDAVAAVNEFEKQLKNKIRVNLKSADPAAYMDRVEKYRCTYLGCYEEDIPAELKGVDIVMITPKDIKRAQRVFYNVSEKTWDEICTRNGETGCRWHDLRHRLKSNEFNVDCFYFL